MAWDYFKDGQMMEPAGLKVVELIELANTQRETKYLVYMLCCGSTRIMRHDLIVGRIRRNSLLCMDCSADQNRRKANEARHAEAQDSRSGQEESKPIPGWYISMLELCRKTNPLWPPPCSTVMERFYWWKENEI